MSLSLARPRILPLPHGARDSGDVAFGNPGSRPARRDRIDTLEFRQLRHQTKNALQRLLCEIARNAELQTTSEAKAVFDDLERRICLTARVSDAMFGLTAHPGPMERRLTMLAGAMSGLLGEKGQEIDCQVQVDGACPEAIEDTVLRVAHEMIGNSIRHGLTGRAAGRLTIRLLCNGQSIRLQVLDDGVGITVDPVTAPTEGQRPKEGFSLMRELAADHGGCVTLSREGNRTAAELRIPTARTVGFSIMKGANR